jgi:ABC transporter substrate binding protein
MASKLDNLLQAIIRANDAGLTVGAITAKFVGKSSAKAKDREAELREKLVSLVQEGAIWGPVKHGVAQYYFATGRGPSIETASALVGRLVLQSGAKLLSRPGLQSSVAGALIMSGDALFITERDRIIAYAERYAVPAIYPYREDTVSGGLVSYGPSIAECYRLLGVYTGRILKGEKPTDLPVQRVTRIYLAFNLKTAKALGLTIPETLLATADQVIE